MVSEKYKHAVTVVICNYNYGKFIGDCLESLARQTHIPEGLIVVDDASTDNSRSVVEAFLAAKGHLFRDRMFIPMRDNGGKMACVNRAVHLVETPYTIILDADDFLPDNAIETLLDRLLAARADNPYVGFVYTDSYLIDADGAEIGRGRSAPWCRERLRTHSYIPDCALTVSTALKRAAPFDESIRVGSKHHKWIKIADEGWIGRHIAEPLFFYRMHQHNLSGIGNSILGEGDARKDRLLSGYWTAAGSIAASDGEPGLPTEPATIS